LQLNLLFRDPTAAEIVTRLNTEKILDAPSGC